MEFHTIGEEKTQTLLLIPGLGVSYEIFLPLVDHPEEVAERFINLFEH